MIPETALFWEQFLIVRTCYNIHRPSKVQRSFNLPVYPPQGWTWLDSWILPPKYPNVIKHPQDAIFCYVSFKVPVNGGKKNSPLLGGLKSHFVNPFSRVLGPLPAGRTPWLINRGYFTNHLPRWSSKSQISYTCILLLLQPIHPSQTNRTNLENPPFFS